MGSVEGRVAIQYVNAQNPKDNFTFKCHRSNGVTNGFQDIYAVNDIAFHPAHGTLATVGSDGRFSFWDKVRMNFTGYFCSKGDKSKIMATNVNYFNNLIFRTHEQSLKPPKLWNKQLLAVHLVAMGKYSHMQ